MLKKREKNKQKNDNTILVEFVVEDYRFLKMYKSLIGKLLKDEVSKYLSAFNFHVSKIEELMNKQNLKIVDLSGKVYDEGLSVNPLNIEDFGKDDKLIIDQILEPLIISTIDGAIVKSGTVMLKKCEEEKGE